MDGSMDGSQTVEMLELKQIPTDSDFDDIPPTAKRLELQKIPTDSDRDSDDMTSLTSESSANDLGELTTSTILDPIIKGSAEAAAAISSAEPVFQHIDGSSNSCLAAAKSLPFIDPHQRSFNTSDPNSTSSFNHGTDKLPPSPGTAKQNFIKEVTAALSTMRSTNAAPAPLIQPTMAPSSLPSHLPRQQSEPCAPPSSPASTGRARANTDIHKAPKPTLLSKSRKSGAFFIRRDETNIFLAGGDCAMPATHHANPRIRPTSQLPPLVELTPLNLLPSAESVMVSNSNGDTSTTVNSGSNSASPASSRSKPGGN